MPKKHEIFARLVADIFQAAGDLRRSGEAIARQAGQTQARWQVMSVVSDGDWTVPDVARRLGVARQGVQRIADDLVAAGLARHEVNPRHRRSAFLRLTEAGQEVLAQISAAATVQNRAVADRFAADELLAAQDTLRRIMAALGNSGVRGGEPRR